MHIVEAIVDRRKSALVGNVLIDLDLAIQVIWTSVLLASKGIAKKCVNRPSTRPGSSVRPLTPPKAVPRHVLPVTSWNLREITDGLRSTTEVTHGRVEISFPAAATPMTVETPHPL